MIFSAPLATRESLGFSFSCGARERVESLPQGSMKPGRASRAPKIKRERSRKDLKAIVQKKDGKETLPVHERGRLPLPDTLVVKTCCLFGPAATSNAPAHNEDQC